jgi:hypothetical protein
MTPLSQAELRSLAGRIGALLPAREIVIFGGAAHAMLAPDSPASGDIDVAVRGTAQDARACRERLAASTSCGCPTPVRPYWVHLTRPLATFDVPWSGTVLDISFMDHWPQAHFDIETVTIHWPSMEVSDPWRVLQRPVTTIRLVTSLSDENPVLLLSRIFKLAAKYGLDLATDTHLADLAGKAAALAAAWAPSDDFHGRYAHEAHQRHFHAAVRRAADPEAFIGSCLASGILDARLRPLADALRSGHSLVGEVAAAAQAHNRDEFWARVDTLVPAAPGWRGYRPAQRAEAASHKGVRPHGLTLTEGTTT